MKKIILACIAAAAMALAASTALASTHTDSARTQVLKIDAPSSGDLMFNTRKLSAHPGKATIEFTNHSTQVPHNFTLSLRGHVVAATPTIKDRTANITVTLKRGDYTYYCSVPGHEEAGMKGTLAVS